MEWKKHLEKNPIQKIDPKNSKDKLKKHKMDKRKCCIIKTNKFTIIAMNFVQEQLKTEKIKMKLQHVNKNH